MLVKGFFNCHTPVKLFNMVKRTSLSFTLHFPLAEDKAIYNTSSLLPLVHASCKNLFGTVMASSVLMNTSFQAKVV